METLGGGTAGCKLAALADPSKSQYVVERNVQSPSRAYRDGVQQIDGSAVLHKIEIYSQGDLQTIAERPERRLALIDRPNQRRVAELTKRVGEVTEQLKLLGPKLRQQRTEIESRQAKVQALETSKRQLADLQASRPSLSPELESERIAYEDRRRAYERLKVAVQAHGRAMDAARVMIAEEAGLRDASTFAANFGTTASKAISGVMVELAEECPRIRVIAERSVKLDKTLAELASEFEQKIARYYPLCKEQQSVNDALKTEESLRQSSRRWRP